MAREPFIEMSVGLEDRSDLEVMTCLAVVILVGDAGDCPLTDTGLSYESIVASGYVRRHKERGEKEGGGGKQVGLARWSRKFVV